MHRIPKEITLNLALGRHARMQASILAFDSDCVHRLPDYACDYQIRLRKGGGPKGLLLILFIQPIHILFYLLVRSVQV